MKASLIYELERAHGISTSMLVVNPERVAGAEAARFTALLKTAAEALEEAVNIAVRADRNARSELTGDVEASLNEPHQASVDSDGPNPLNPTPPTNGKDD